MNWNCPECHAKTEIPKQVPLNFCPMCGAEVRQKPRFGFKSIFTFLMLFYVPFAFFCIFAVLLWFLTPRNQSDTTKEISMKKVDADYVLSLPNYVTLVLKHIPPGSFIMGSPLDELGRDIDEKQHSVPIADEFWRGQYEVTFAQFYGVMGKKKPQGEDDNIPVQITRQEAKFFIRRLNDILAKKSELPDNYSFALPKENQWEYACRAGTTSALYNGKNLTVKNECDFDPNLDEVAWYTGNNDEIIWYNITELESHINGYVPSPITKIRPVGLKKPNNWGLYDMLGNVPEMCEDRYKAYPGGYVSDDQSNDKTDMDYYHFVIRGVGRRRTANTCRSAYRGSSPHFWLNGLRIVLSKTEEKK